MTTPHIPFTRLTAVPLSVSTVPVALASREVLDGLIRGRCALEVVNTSSVTVYIGDSSVDSTHGLPIKAGERCYLPVTLGARGTLFISADEQATVTLAEYFS